MKIYSVECESNDWNDDLFNGDLQDCLNYINNYCDEERTEGKVRIALLEVDDNGVVIECLALYYLEELM